MPTGKGSRRAFLLKLVQQSYKYPSPVVASRENAVHTFPFSVCLVARLNVNIEKDYRTDFWRKLETLLGVAGRGLLSENYMCTKYYNTLFLAVNLCTLIRYWSVTVLIPLSDLNSIKHLSL